MSSGQFPSFTRAFSPAVVAHTTNSWQDELSRRMNALSLASTMGEIELCLPTAYRGYLMPVLRKLAAITEKSGRVKRSLGSLERNKATGTLPSSIQSLPVPNLQLTSEYTSIAGAAFAQAVASKVTSLKAGLLDDFIDVKKKELEHLESLLNMEVHYPDICKGVRDVYNSLAEVHREPVFERVEGEHGPENKLTGWKESSVYLKEYQRLITDLPTFIARIIDIERQKIAAEDAKVEAKKNLKDSADVEMGDASTSSRAVEDRIKSEVAKALKSAGISPKDSKVRDCLLSRSLYFGNTHFVSGRPVQARPEEEIPRQHVHRWQAPQEGEVFNGFESWDGQVGSSGASQQGPCQVTQEQQEQAEEVVLTTPHIRYDDPRSYPDELLMLPSPLAIRYLLCHVPLHRLEAAKFRGSVHLGPGVFLSHDVLASSLSAGLRFLLYTRPKKYIPIDAYNNLCETIRWKVYFEQLGANDKDFDPDYQVRKRKVDDKTKAPPAPAYVEAGLMRGLTYVENYLNKFMPQIRKSSRDHGHVDLTRLEEYCLENNLLISMTDKNLGSAIVTRDWFIEKCTAILSDTRDYQEISAAEKDVILERTRDAVNHMCAYGSEYQRSLNEQLLRFLRSNVPDLETEQAAVPKFYGIPKIHKTPTKMRPIVPCHSTLQGPAAKFVSKELKPLVNGCKYVIRGSKDLAQKLAKISIPKGAKGWLVSGDVVAFYPNIPREKCRRIVKSKWLREIGIPLGTSEEAKFRRDLFAKALDLANTDLIMDFLDKSYLQKRGLAMGIHCSPDMANLYGAKFEEEILRNNNPFLFYGRYIDDVLGVVIAPSREAAISAASRIKFDDCTIEWEASEWNTPFLDMLVYIDPVSGKIEHKPYRKALNHHERIPWASHHPKDVKKGTFLGEMSRLATLSSRLEHYLEAIKDLGDLYLGRGYPDLLVKRWIKDNLAKRWESRLAQPTEEGASGVFVLKSQFNPIWEKFNVKELQDHLLDPMIDYVSQTQWCDVDGCTRPEHALNLPRPRPAQNESASHGDVGVGKRRGDFDDDIVDSVMDIMADGSLRVDIEATGDLRTESRLRKKRMRLQTAAFEAAQEVPFYAQALPRRTVLPSGSRLRDVGGSRERAPVPIRRCDDPRTPEVFRLAEPEGPLSWAIVSKMHNGITVGIGREAIFDLRKTDLLDRRLLVSRKRTMNTFDLTRKWNGAVLQQYIDDVNDDAMSLDAWE